MLASWRQSFPCFKKMIWAKTAKHLSSSRRRDACNEHISSPHCSTWKYNKSLSTVGVFKFSFPTKSSLALGNLQSFAHGATSNKILFHVVCASESWRRETRWLLVDIVEVLICHRLQACVQTVAPPEIQTFNQPSF